MTIGQRRLRIIGRGHDLRLRLAGDWEADPLDALCEAGRLGDAVEKMQRDLVRRARAGGRSWAEIGSALGVSKQAAWERFASPEES
jgi:hypothetical protein